MIKLPMVEYMWGGHRGENDLPHWLMPIKAEQVRRAEAFFSLVNSLQERGKPVNEPLDGNELFASDLFKKVQDVVNWQLGSSEGLAILQKLQKRFTHGGRLQQGGESMWDIHPPVELDVVTFPELIEWIRSRGPFGVIAYLLKQGRDIQQIEEFLNSVCISGCGFLEIIILGTDGGGVRCWGVTTSWEEQSGERVKVWGKIGIWDQWWGSLKYPANPARKRLEGPFLYSLSLLSMFEMGQMTEQWGIPLAFVVAGHDDNNVRAFLGDPFVKIGGVNVNMASIPILDDKEPAYAAHKIEMTVEEWRQAHENFFKKIPGASEVTVFGYGLEPKSPLGRYGSLKFSCGYEGGNFRIVPVEST